MIMIALYFFAGFILGYLARPYLNIDAAKLNNDLQSMRGAKK